MEAGEPAAHVLQNVPERRGAACAGVGVSVLYNFVNKVLNDLGGSSRAGNSTSHAEGLCGNVSDNGIDAADDGLKELDNVVQHFWALICSLVFAVKEYFKTLYRATDAFTKMAPSRSDLEDEEEEYRKVLNWVNKLS